MDSAATVIERCRSDLTQGKPVVLRHQTHFVSTRYLVVSTAKVDSTTLEFAAAQRNGAFMIAVSPEQLERAGQDIGFQPSQLSGRRNPNPPSEPLSITLAALAELLGSASTEPKAVAALSETTGVRIVRTCWGGVLANANPVNAAADIVRGAGLGSTCLVVRLAESAEPVRIDERELATVSVHLVAEFRRTGRAITSMGEPARLPMECGEFLVHIYQEIATGLEHLALSLGNVPASASPLVRLHSECLTGDVFGSLRCDCGPQLSLALKRIASEGGGLLLYLRQEGRGIGLLGKLQAYAIQDAGFDTVDANVEVGFPPDLRDYRVAASMLSDLGVRSVRLLTNNPMKIESLERSGIRVSERIPLPVKPCPENMAYLQVKNQRMGHLLTI